MNQPLKDREIDINAVRQPDCSVVVIHKLLKSAIRKRNKMQVFKYNQWWLTWLGISSKRLNEPTNDFFTTINSYVMIISMTVSMPICGAYALYLSRDDLQRFFQAFYIVSAGIQCVGAYLSIGNNMILVKSVMNEVQRISDSGEFLVLEHKKLHSFENQQFAHEFSIYNYSHFFY